jgi:hypothetical protein
MIKDPPNIITHLLEFTNNVKDCKKGSPLEI